MPLTKRNPSLPTRLRCFLGGHAWVTSKTYAGHRTCRRCRFREPLAQDAAPQPTIAARAPGDPVADTLAG